MDGVSFLIVQVVDTIRTEWGMFHLVSTVGVFCRSMWSVLVDVTGKRCGWSQWTFQHRHMFFVVTPVLGLRS